MLSLTSIITVSVVVLIIVVVKAMMIIRVNNEINASIANDSGKKNGCADEDVSNDMPNAINNNAINDNAIISNAINNNAAGNNNPADS